ncbi:MAG: hypothetical protein QOF90_537 [Acetobacteraceae bacterium]|jgi:hypothetical protein|nr:hypothetical protein [Acetobacteraceae bacterium]MEA2775131.1 hypothetical protein [Acetobacteraceae bacterium]
MSNDVIAAAVHLTDVLARENDALRRVDYAAAVALAPDKEAAVTALSAHSVPFGFPVALARRLRDLAAENQEQLALAITVQTRVVQIVARAYAPPKAENRYAPRAAKSAGYRPTALALSTRA